jgi:uncharacterized protein YecT (DUF1311 family)
MRRAHIVLVACFVVAASAAHAESAADWYGEEYQGCRNGSTYDIVMCVDKLVKAWDARVDAAYKKLIGMTAEKDRRAALKKSQALWLKFRDANCNWYDTGEGTIHRLEAGECMRTLTAARALELEAEGETH